MKKTSIFPWGLFAAVTVMTLINAIVSLEKRSSEQTPFNLVNAIFVMALPVAFALLAALILSRQPGNVIGWLLFMPALAGILPADAYIRTFTSLPSQPPTLLLLALWANSWNWLLLIFPILFIPVLFPTGRPPSPRWRWLIIAGLGICAIFLFLATFQSSFSTADYGMDWTIANPIGFIPDYAFGNFFLIPWLIGLAALTLLSVASLFVRYRQALLVEREQIKWLLYACGLFTAIYVPLFWISNLTTIIRDVWNLLFFVSILTIPISIAIAILRYRLWDIDVIIRRTLVYGMLSVTLGLVFFGGVALLQQVLGRLIGIENSPVVVVVSTLTIAALFNPLRTRIQNGIDRRFYRRKYDAQKMLEAFGQSARNETDLDDLTTGLVNVVKEAVQPAQLEIWIKPSRQ
jgi:hypothetical protein